MFNKYKNEIIVSILILAFSVAFYNLYGIILPFVIGLLLAFKCQPVISFIRKQFKNKILSTIIFLVGLSIFFVLFLFFFANYINKDFKRLQNSFSILKSQNKAKLDNAGIVIKEFVSKFYNINNLENDLKNQVDSLKTKALDNKESGLDTKAIEDSFKSIISGFQSETEQETTHNKGFGLMLILVMSLVYFVLILFNFEYFDSLKKQYWGGKIESKYNLFINDFNQSFVKYFSLRTKIVLLLSIIYLTAFIILNLPGFIIFTILIVLLSYIPYFQYIVLIPISISCLVLSTEGQQGFLFYYGIVVGVFVLASLVEEIVLNPFIMEKNIGMNPVIMVLAISVWNYVLGIPGILIGIPLSSFIIIYVKRYFLESYLKLNEKTSNE